MSLSMSMSMSMPESESVLSALYPCHGAFINFQRDLNCRLEQRKGEKRAYGRKLLCCLLRTEKEAEED